MNGVAGLSHSHKHAVNSARIFSQTNPVFVGVGGLVLFPGTPLLEEAEHGAFDPLSEREMLEELLAFVEELTCDCYFNTHHTVSGYNLSGPDFLRRKNTIVSVLRNEIEHGNLERITRIRATKATL